MPRDPEPDDDALDPSLELDAREAERARRRDHDAEAARRELMRPGMGKVFKQITDSWGEKAAPEPKHAHDPKHTRKSRQRDA